MDLNKASLFALFLRLKKNFNFYMIVEKTSEIFVKK